MSKKSFELGDVVRNPATREEGTIVRVVRRSDLRASAAESKPKNDDPAYIVLLPATNLWPAKEALWQAAEIEIVKLKTQD